MRSGQTTGKGALFAKFFREQRVFCEKLPEQMEITFCLRQSAKPQLKSIPDFIRLTLKGLAVLFLLLRENLLYSFPIRIS
jgi:hypothetical protein